MTARMLLSELLPDISLPSDVEISGLVMDSRHVTPGDAFVAIAGFGAHGLGFVKQAQAQGAVVILYEPPAPADLPVPVGAIAVPKLRARLGAMADQLYGYPSQLLTMVGVTGTNGKTSTVQLLSQAWHLQGKSSGSIGTLGAGMFGNLQTNGFTTPLVLQNHTLLAQMRDAGATAVAMEVSSHALDQGRVDNVHFDIAVFTNLTRDHLDYHGDMAHYAAAKRKLLTWPGLKAAVVNIDHTYGQQFYQALSGLLPELRLIPISADNNNYQLAKKYNQKSHLFYKPIIFAQNVQLNNKGIQFLLSIDEKIYPIHSPLLGQFNVDNLLSVAGVLYGLNESPDAIANLLTQLKPIDGRMNRLGGDGHLPLVVIDYAHTPDALEQALKSLHEHNPQRLLCVFGCGGERDNGKRPQMAAIAEKYANSIIVTDDNPRCENGDQIIQHIMEGFSESAKKSKVVIERNRGNAIHAAIGQTNAYDIILIAGKGHETYQEIEGVRHDFNDTHIAKIALEGK